MASDEVKVGMAETKAKQLDRYRKSLPDNGDCGGGLYEIEVPHQTVWLFHRDVAMRALEVLKMIGLRGRFKGKVLK